MKIAQLKYFVEVCRYQNVTKAAKALFISQPSITSAIQELEKEFGVNLFYRQSKRMILTSEGEFFYHQAIEILKKADETARIMKNFGGQNNIIKLGIPPMFGSHFFPGFFRVFHEQFPDIQFEIQEAGTLQTRELILSDELDAAFIITNDLPDTNFEVLPLLETELVMAVSRKNPLSARTSISADMLVDEPLILMPAGSYSNQAVTDLFTEANVTPKVMLYSSQVSLSRQFAENNDAAVFMFREMAESDPNLAAVSLNPPIPVSIGLIWKSGRYIYTGTAALIETARTYSFK